MGMGTRKIAILTLIIVLLTFLHFNINVSGDTNPPEVTNVKHIYEFPTYNETIEISATITDIDGVDTNTVTLMHCIYPAGICKEPITMNYLGNDLYNATIGPYPGNHTVDYYFIAQDNASNTNTTDYFWISIVDYIETTIQMEPSPSFPDNKVWVNGTAFYGYTNATGTHPNSSAPARNSAVNVSIVETGDSWLGQVDQTGNYSLYITMPQVPDTYTINVTVTNRTIMGYNETTILVQPLMIAHSPVLSHTVRFPLDPLWVNGTATYNNGSVVLYSNVSVKILETSQEWFGSTDWEGRCSIEIIAPNIPGNYNIEVNVTNETYGITNTTVLALFVTNIPVPDISISPSDISLSDPNPIVNQEIMISLDLHNTGAFEASLFFVDVYIEGGPVFSQLVTSLSAGGTTTLSFNWSTVVQGDYIVLVQTDPTNSVAEAIENNNNASLQFFVDGDNDNDGIGDTIDDDDDNDGYTDEQDDFRFDPTEWSDTDNDGVGDNRDYDDDGDGIVDWKDRFPLDIGEWEDTDRDGIGDNADGDDDNDGVDDADDAFPENNKEWGDNDEDGLGDIVDWDDDNDGLPDYWEESYNLYPNNPGDVLLDHDGDGLNNMEEYELGTSPKNKDSDGDEVWDSDDYAPLNGLIKVDPDELLVERFVLTEMLTVSISIILILLMLTTFNRDEDKD